MQSPQTLTDLKEKELQEFLVKDWSIAEDEVEEVSMGALFQDHGRLSSELLEALSPLREPIIFVPRDVPRYAHCRCFINVGIQAENIRAVGQRIVSLNFAVKLVCILTLVHDLESELGRQGVPLRGMLACSILGYRCLSCR